MTASWCLLGLAGLGRGSAESATTAFRTGLELAVANNLPTPVLYSLMGLARAFAADGRTEMAARQLVHKVNVTNNPYSGLAQEALDDLSEEQAKRIDKAGLTIPLDEAIALALDS